MSPGRGDLVGRFWLDVVEHGEKIFCLNRRGVLGGAAGLRVGPMVSFLPPSILKQLFISISKLRT